MRNFNIYIKGEKKKWKQNATRFSLKCLWSTFYRALHQRTAIKIHQMTRALFCARAHSRTPIFYLCVPWVLFHSALQTIFFKNANRVISYYLFHSFKLHFMNAPERTFMTGWWSRSFCLAKFLWRWNRVQRAKKKNKRNEQLWYSFEKTAYEVWFT